ncbi:MAG: hypothetical protein Q4A82_04155 [Corynebacterium sp.]|nr:hypothetical protein [Corynebacterium sp.]
MITPAMLRRGIIPMSMNLQHATREQATTAAAELVALGFVANPTELQQLSPAGLKNLLMQAAIVVGADRTWRPMFSGFPKQVMKMSDMDILVKQLMHYYTYGTWWPNVTEAFARTKLKKTDWSRNYQKLTLTKLTPEMVSTEWNKAVALSPTDQQFAIDIARALNLNVPELMARTTFHNGENFAVALCTMTDPTEILDTGLQYARNATYVLRTILAAYCKDRTRAVDLMCHRYLPVNMRSIPRASRRAIIQALARFNDQTNLDLLVHHRVIWRRALRPVHPYELAEAQKVAPHLDIIFGRSQHRTFNAQVELALRNHDVFTAMQLLSTNPGNLVRRIDHLMRLVDSSGEEQEKAALIAAISDAAPQVRLTTLISCYNGISNRLASTKVYRLRSRNVLRISETTPVDSALKQEVLETLETAMMMVLMAAPAPTEPVKVGSMIPVELVQRTASKSKIALARGQRLKLNQGDVVRLFVHWYGHDVDLGVCFTDEGLQEQLGYLDYTNLSANQWKKVVVHSGDITYAPQPEGACEFIDIHSKLHTKMPKVRYAIPQLISYSGLCFRDIDNIAGVMVRSSGMAGKVFEPRTVETATSVLVQSTSSIPFIMDLKTNELIWMDTSLGTQSGLFNAGDSAGVHMVRAELEALSNMMTNGKLLSLWAEAHDMPTVPSVGDEAATRAQVAELLSID